MEGRWERAAMPIFKWAIVPLALFGFGYFALGPWLSGEKSDSSNGSRHVDTSLVNQKPIEPGERKWVPVSPPQVDVSVYRKEEPVEEFDPDYPFDDAVLPDIEPPDDEDIDEAGVGGMNPPTTTGGAEPPTTTGGNDGEDPLRKSAFRGIGNWR